MHRASNAKIVSTPHVHHFYYASGEQPIGFSSSDAPGVGYRYVYDGLGRRVAKETINTTTGAIERRATQTLYRTRTSTGTHTSPLLFAGQYKDAESGWAYNRFHYYNPTLGAYNAQAPLGQAPRLASAQGYADHAAFWVDVLGLMSHQRTIPSSVDELPNGKFPRNAHLSGSTKHFPVGSEMAERYPNGVTFNEKGFPVFDEWGHEIDGKPMDLQLPPNTWELSRAQHDSILDDAAGISAEYRQQF